MSIGRLAGGPRFALHSRALIIICFAGFSTTWNLLSAGAVDLEMDRLFQDLRFATRLLWKDRGFTLTVVATLALCVAANTSIFAVVNSVLLKPLPFADPERIATIFNSYPGA